MTSNLERTVVYIGMFTHLPGSKEGPALREHTKYLCYEKNDSESSTYPWEKIVREVYDLLDASIKQDVHLIFREDNVTRLDSQSVDEVHVYNVFSDPSVPKKSCDELFDDAVRILKPGGHLYSGETITPTGYPPSILLHKSFRYCLDAQLLVPNPLTVLSEENVSDFKKKFTLKRQGVVGEESDYYSLLDKMGISDIVRYSFSQEDKEVFFQHRGKASNTNNGYLLRLTKL
jgi:hypothetical protein